MTGRRFFAAVVVAIGVSGQLLPDHPLTSVARAAPTQKAPEKAAADVRARELFEKGDTAYAEGRYEEAYASFLEAYELSGRPQLLFNVSNALERLGKYAEAVDALEKYLASGKAKDRDVVQKRLANLRKRVEEQRIAEERAREEEEKRRAAEKANEPPPSDGSAEPTSPRAPEPPPEKPTRILPIALLGAGGAALAASGVFGLLTLSARSDVEAGCRAAPAGRLCSSDAQSAIDRDKTFGLVTDIALVSGVILGGAGLYFLLAGDGDDKASVKVGGGARRPAGARDGNSMRDKLIELGKTKGFGVEVVGTF
ncbi:MAG: tetratricopeptide repeat protein [Labilithrix sp.]|nr:tetratricopeptide repeat protein [Labilithrix sp.]